MATIKQFANGLTPWFLRTLKFNGIRDSIANEIDAIRANFNSLRDSVKWDLFHNSQIVYLEHYLNDKFGIPYSVATRDADIVSKTIIWIESKNMVPVFIFNKIEGRPPFYVYNKSESQPETYLKNYSEFLSVSNFIVWVPNTLTYNETVLEKLINFFKLGGKSFQIQNY